MIGVLPTDSGPVLHVASDPSWLDYMAAFSGVLGVVLAVAALWYSRLQGVKAQQAIAHERRAVLELQVLRELLELADDAKIQVVAGPGGGAIGAFECLFMSGSVEGRLALLPPDELPLWRSPANHWTLRADDVDPSIPPPPDDLYLNVPTLLDEEAAEEDESGSRYLDETHTRMRLHSDVIQALKRRTKETV